MNAINTNLQSEQQNLFRGDAHQTACEKGYDRLSDLELLGKLVGVREAKKIYGGTLTNLFAANDQAPAQVQVVQELVKRWMKEELQAGDVLNSPQSVRDFCKMHFAGQEFESFVAIFLDAQHRVIEADELFKGTLTQTSVYPREVVKAALKHNAAAVIFAHNHPSGATEPSRADETLTARLKETLALVDVRVLDHFVVAGNQIMSFAERGLI